MFNLQYSWKLKSEKKMIIITDSKIIFTLYNSFQIRFDCPFA